jgi:enamine deaminase RidA (YjgF/YER057c/UK114 family)
VLGFSRGIRAGNLVFTSGMTATNLAGEVVFESVYDQMRMIYEKIDLILKAYGSGLKDVVKETWYASSFENIEEFGRAHREAFGDVRPAITGIVVQLLDPKMKIEIDAIAVIRDGGTGDPNLQRVVSA